MDAIQHTACEKIPEEKIREVSKVELLTPAERRRTHYSSDQEDDNWDNIGINRLRRGWKHVSNASVKPEEGLKLLQKEVKSGYCNLKSLGVFGENILHWALLMHNKPVSSWLIGKYEFLRTAVYGMGYNVNPLYKGEGCLHIAIANRDMEMALALLDSYEVEQFEMSSFSSDCPVDRGYPLNSQRAVGEFFQKTGDNSVYYGETALDFAVSTDQTDMVDLLMGYPPQKEKSFNGKWRASLKLKDSHHQNTVYHICAMRGLVKMWYIIIHHMELTMSAELGIDVDEVEIELQVERWVRSQVNAYGLTPLQVAAYKNNKPMVECILKQTRLRIWKWGEKAFYGYTLNEIDERYKSPHLTPGIPVNSIILSEGHFEMLDLPLIVKLMKAKWNRFGKRWIKIFSFIQFVFCIATTVLFIQAYPQLDNLERPWGRRAIDQGWQKLLWGLVLIKAVYETLTMIIEMATLYRANLALEGEILRQKIESEHQKKAIDYEYELKGKSKSSLRSISNVYEEVHRQQQSGNCCQRIGRYKKSFGIMWSIYFETDLGHVPAEFQNQTSKKRAHTSVAGFFCVLSWISNVGFIVGQWASLMESRPAAHALLVAMICIIVCEYVQLFLWFQTYKQIGRFIFSVVNILYRDVLGFAVVFFVILISFSACFLLLGEYAEVDYIWLRVIYIIFELSVGTGEWFKGKVDSFEEQSPEMDPWRKGLVYVVYSVYITIVLVILMNLLIAVMSETAISLAKQMDTREFTLKLSSVSVVSRRLRAALNVAHFFCRVPDSGYTDGGRSGDDMKILEGRLNFREDEVARISKIYDRDTVNLRDYYTDMRYWAVLEHEAIDEDKDGQTGKPEEQFLGDKYEGIVR